MSPARPPDPRARPSRPRRTASSSPREDVLETRENPSSREVLPPKIPLRKPKTSEPAPPRTGRGDRVVVEGAAQRFAERVQARHRVTRAKVTVAAVVLASLAVLGWVGLASPLLALDLARVNVVGTGQTVSLDDVLGVVSPHAGEPLSRLDTVVLRSQLLEVRGVKDARVLRDWPRGLTVVITPRQAVAAVPAVSGGLMLLDAEGAALGTVEAPPDGLPVVDVPEGDARALEAALSVVHSLPPDLAAQVTTLIATTQDTVTLKLSDGVTVVWGSAEDNRLKAEVVAALRADETLTDVTAIDVSAPRLPVVR